MPLYDYKCRACSKVTEVRHGFREPYDGSCPDCGGDLARVFNPAGIVFKGSGFYLTDSRKAVSESSSSTPSSSDSKSSDTKSSDAKPSDAKSATPAPTASSSTSDSGPKKSESSAA